MPSFSSIFCLVMRSVIVSIFTSLFNNYIRCFADSALLNFFNAPSSLWITYLCRLVISTISQSQITKCLQPAAEIYSRKLDATPPAPIQIIVDSLIFRIYYFVKHYKVSCLMYLSSPVDIEVVHVSHSILYSNHFSYLFKPFALYALVCI